MGIAKISVPVNSPTKYYTNLYDRIPLTYITILLQDNIILCQEIFLLFWHGSLNYTIFYDECKDSNAKNYNNNKQSMFHVYVLGHFYAEVIT